MVNNHLQDITAYQIAQSVRELVQDFIRLKNQFESFFPEEMIRFRNRFEESPPRGEARRSANWLLIVSIISILNKQTSPTMGELSNTLSVPLSTATRTLDWLVDNGYATRLPDEHDRRIVRVRLTDAGRKVYETATRYQARWVQQLLTGLTDDEGKTLLGILQKANESFKQKTPLQFFHSQPVSENTCEADSLTSQDVTKRKFFENIP